MISVVVLTLNSRKFIASCLDSVLAQGENAVEVIVVDNGSVDGSVNFIKEKYPGAKLVANNSNLGACYARNQGIKSALGKWILVLDCDVVLDSGFIKEIMELADNANDTIGIIAPKILTSDKNRIYSCGVYMSWLGRFHDIGKGSVDTLRFNIGAPVFGACCAAVLYRAKMLEDIKDRYGYFDERFFFLFEDADLSWRAKKKNWICRHYPQLRCFHHGNSSLTDQRTRKFLSFRNRQLAILKNQNPLVILLMFPLYLVYDLPRFLILAVKFKCNFPKLKIN